jgi:predicted amidophosphoribosyltransferase
MSENKLNSLRNCKKCGRLFSSVDGSALCSRCNDNVDDSFTRVREYIYDNPTSSVKDVSHGTGVDADAILKWIREGKITLADNSNIAFCERCGSPTEGARFCGKCVRELTNGLKKGMQDTAGPAIKHRGMHIKEEKE